MNHTSLKHPNIAREMSVQKYLGKHMLSRKIEDTINAAVRAKTPDPVLFIVS